MSQPERGGKEIWRTIRFHLLIAGSAMLLILTGISAGRETFRQWKADEEISGLQKQVEALEGKKIRLLDTIQQFGTVENLDKEARLRLDLKKPGERVMVFRGFDPSSESSAEGAPAPKESTESNVQKWFRYFFLHPS